MNTTHYYNNINSPLKEGKDIEIISNSRSNPHTSADSDDHGKLILSNTNNNSMPWNEHLNNFNQEDGDQDLPVEGGDHDTVSAETVTENGEDSDESFEDEKVRVLNPSDEHFPESTLLSGLQIDGQHQEILQEMSSQNSNTFRSCQLPPTDSSLSNDAQTSSSLHASLSASVTIKDKGFNGVETGSNFKSAKDKIKSKSHFSVDPSYFPESYDAASGFLKELLKSYYLKKLSFKKSTKEAPTAGVIVGQQSEDTSVQSQEKKKSANRRRGVGLSAILLALLCIVSSFFIGQLFKMQEELNLKSGKLNQSLELNQEYLEKNRQLELKNRMLKQLAEKAVEEEKRNCDFFDIFSILKSTLGSKKQHNIQELCSHYQRYQQLEAHLTEIIEKSDKPEEPTVQTSIEGVLSSDELSVKNQIDSLIPEELKSEEDYCPTKQLPEKQEYGSVVSDPTPDKSIFKRFLGIIDTFRELSVKNQVSITQQESQPSE